MDAPTDKNKPEVSNDFSRLYYEDIQLSESPEEISSVECPWVTYMICLFE